MFINCLIVLISGSCWCFKQGKLTLRLHHNTYYIKVRQLQIKSMFNWGCCMLHLCHRTTATHTWKRFSKLATILPNEWMNKLTQLEQVTNLKNLCLCFLFAVWYVQTWRWTCMWKSPGKETHFGIRLSTALPLHWLFCRLLSCIWRLLALQTFPPIIIH